MNIRTTPEGFELEVGDRTFTGPTLLHLIENMEGHILYLSERNKVLEQLRPQWAMGYTSDSMAAQACSGSLTQLHKLLGVKNQTMAVLKVRKLMGSEE